jgi:phenylpropionate dioxygenase-like ring-hydroxylating dioxygenase large terminal subunit
MMTQEENDLLTRVGPGTPMGELLRRYWQPVALCEELAPGGPPKPVKILGEDLVLFRDERGRPGLLALHCSHRGADLSYGRVEDGGLRCLYHGWLYDIHGRCLEQPGEAEGGKNREAIRHPSYPCDETAGLILAYLGPGDPPLLPAYEALTASESHIGIRKYFQECNYLRGNEGNIDPIHLSFLHRQFGKNDDRRQGLGVRGTEATPDDLYARDTTPTVEIDLADYGIRIYTVRKIGADKIYLRVSNFILPNLCAVPGETGADGYNINWHVPIDDTHHWKYMLTYRRSAPLDKEAFHRRNAEHVTPDFRLKRNLSNRYLQDREEMKTKVFSGMGPFFPVHDAFATESQGPIEDRTREHLVSSDKSIVAARKLILKAIGEVQDGKEPQHVVREAGNNAFPHLQVLSEVLPSAIDVRERLRQVIAQARGSTIKEQPGEFRPNI